MLVQQRFTSRQATAVAEELGVDFDTVSFDLEQFRRGLEVEPEHGRRDPDTNVTDNDPFLTGKIALAHLRELPDYYERLEHMEIEAGLLAR